jgi:hypothetical protein
MPKRHAWNLATIVLFLVAAIPAAAGVTGAAKGGAAEGVPPSDITFEPISAAHPVCPPFGACPPASQVTTEYLAFGVDFTEFNGHPPVGVFDDPPEKFGGVTGGILDLVTATCGRIVSLGTTTQGVTDFIGMAGGNVGGPSDLLLEAFDAGGGLIGSSIADDGVDADGDLIAEVSDPTNSIASFCVSTPSQDSHGVHFIYLNDPTVVPVELQSYDIE